MGVAKSCAHTILTLSWHAICLVSYVVIGIICILLVVIGPSLFRNFVINPYRSYIKYLPGPKWRGAFASDFGLILNPITSKESSERLTRECGLNVRLQGLGYQDQRLVTYDPITIRYVLGSAADRFPKPAQMRRLVFKLSAMPSDAITVAEGSYHHHLRRIINPAFAPSTVRGHAPVFIRKASELCDNWRSILSEPTTPAVPGVEADSKGNTLIDVNNWLRRLVFDVIGLAGFGYSFDSLQDEKNELFRAHKQLNNLEYEGLNMFIVFALSWPWLESLMWDSTSKVIAETFQTVRQTSKIILDKMRGLNPEGDGKSILGLLLRSNANAAPEDRLTEEELLAQIDAIMVAGSDSTGLSITWGLYELARNPGVQEALRAELQPLGLSENTSTQASASDLDVNVPDHAALFAAIDALPLLDRVVRETLRVHPPAQGTLRTADQDDIVPFSVAPKMPDGSISRAVVTGLGADGVERTGIRVRKGDFIHVPFLPMNNIRDMWGEDGHTFNPDRWLDLPSTARCNPGVIPALASFSVGPHSCPAFRFAMAEMKITIAYIISSFALEETCTILPHNLILTRPLVKTQSRKGFRLPLRVRTL